MKIANTNSRYRFSIPARDFIDRWSQAGPSHHCAVGTGHVSSRIRKLSLLLDMGFTRIC
jgi:L-arabinose isomerase